MIRQLTLLLSADHYLAQDGRFSEGLEQALIAVEELGSLKKLNRWEFARAFRAVGRTREALGMFPRASLARPADSLPPEGCRLAPIDGPKLLAMFESDTERVKGLGRAAANTLRVFDALRRRPAADIDHLARQTGIAYPTAARAVASPFPDSYFEEALPEALPGRTEGA